MANYTQQQLLDAKLELSRRFRHTQGISGFGVGNDVVRVYVEALDARPLLPTEVNGIPLEIVVAGSITARDR